MSPKPFRLMILFSVFLLLGMAVVISRSLTSLSNSARAVGPTDSTNEIEGYRTWARVNSNPYLMNARAATACAPSMPLPAGAKNPHQDKFVTVYVNDIGRQAMLEMKSPNFPEGSIIVKEKLDLPASEAPELLTVMLKRGKGYNPDSGDWEFMVTDGAGTTVRARGKLDNCQTCHMSRPKTDYIFRTYLPDDVANKLK